MLRSASTRTILAISAGAFAVYALALALPGTRELEAWGVDAQQRVRYAWSGPRISPDLALIVVDDYSVNPAASPLSEPWGRGGWLTRDLWVQQMQFHTEFFRPRVLAYDILFEDVGREESPVEVEALARLQTFDSYAARRRQVQALERGGNEEMENQVLNMADAKAAGGGPLPVFGYLFPEAASVPVTAEEASWMRRRALPEGIVRNAGRMPAAERVRPPLRTLVDAGAGLGAINATLEDGVVRRLPLVLAFRGPDGTVSHHPSLALAVFLHGLGIDPAALHPRGEGLPSMEVVPGRSLLLETTEGRWEAPVDASCRLYLQTRFRFLDVPTNLSYSRVNEAGLVLAAHVHPLGTPPPPPTALARAREVVGSLAGRTVFIAQGFTGSGDIGNFPLQDNVPNVMAHLTAADNLMRRDFLRPPSARTALVLGALAALAAAWANLRWSTGRAGLFTVGLALAYPGAAFACLCLLGRSFYLFSPTVLLGGLFAAHAFHGFLGESRRRREIRSLFSVMVSPRILDLMEQRPGALSLEGRKAEASIFFSDLAGFTTISEKLSPQDLSALLNRYLTPMTDIVLDSDGSVDKYQGDAIMAVWGAPYPDPDHASKACRAAVLQLRRLQALAREIEADTGVRIDMRIGINSGTVSAGNMGSLRKVQYTVMGDAVNLAARLEPINKDYGTRCIIGPATRAALRPEEGLVTRLLDRIVVKGKTEAVEIHELSALAERPSWMNDYESGLRALWDRQWDRAERAFHAVLAREPGEGASTCMLARLQSYRLQPPPPEWSGAHIRTAKD